MAGVLWNAAIWFGLGGVFIPLAILAWQSFVWLKIGQWPTLLVQNILSYFTIVPPFFEWVGVQKLENGLLKQSASYIIFGLGMVGAIICVYLATRIENHQWKRDEERRMAQEAKNSVQ